MTARCSRGIVAGPSRSTAARWSPTHDGGSHCVAARAAGRRQPLARSPAEPRLGPHHRARPFSRRLLRRGRALGPPAPAGMGRRAERDPVPRSLDQRRRGEGPRRAHRGDRADRKRPLCRSRAGAAAAADRARRSGQRSRRASRESAAAFGRGDPRRVSRAQRGARPGIAAGTALPRRRSRLRARMARSHRSARAFDAQFRLGRARPGARRRAPRRREHHPPRGLRETRRDRDHEARRRHQCVRTDAIPPGGDAARSRRRAPRGGRPGDRAATRDPASGRGLLVRGGSRRSPSRRGALRNPGRRGRGGGTARQLPRGGPVPARMIALLAIGLVAAAKPPPPAHRPLDDVQNQLEEEREIAAQIAGREATLLGRLAELERQIDLEGRANRVAQARLRAATGQLVAAEERARAAQTDVNRRLDALSPRLVARYKLGREGYLRFLLGAQSIADLLKRRRLFDALIASDFDDLTRLRFAEQGAKASRDELSQAQQELSRAAREEADKRSALEQRAREQRKLLAAVQEEKSLHEEAVAELEEAERELTGRIGELQKTPQAPRTSAQLHTLKTRRGKLAFPIEEGRIEAHFGRAVDPRFGTVTVQRGIDVRCPEGTPVHAIAAGTVAHAGWFRGYGNLLIVDHGHGYFSLMAHLATLARAKDDVVRAGEVVGTVGDTGSLKGPYLYFELRDGQTALDPERWLVKPPRPQ